MPGFITIDGGVSRPLLLSDPTPPRSARCRGAVLTFVCLFCCLSAVACSVALLGAVHSSRGQSQHIESAVALDNPLVFEPGFLHDFVTLKQCGTVDKKLLETMQKGCQMPRLILESGQEGMDIVMGAVRSGFRGLDIPARRLDRYKAGVAAALAQLFEAGIPRESLFLQLQIDPRFAAELNPNKTITMQVVLSIMNNVKKLGLQYIDSLVLSEPYPSHPQTMEAWAAMEDSVQAGVAKQLGIRNAASLDQVRRVYRDATKMKPAFVQQMAYASGNLEQEMRDWCRETGVSIQWNWTQALIANRRAVDSETMQALAKKYSVNPPALLFRYMVGLGTVPLVSMQNGYREYNSAWRVPLAVKDAETVDALLKQHRTGEAEYAALEAEEIERAKEREREKVREKERQQQQEKKQTELSQDEKKRFGPLAKSKEQLDTWMTNRDKEIKKALDYNARREKEIAQWKIDASKIQALQHEAPKPRILYLPKLVDGHEVLDQYVTGMWKANNSKLNSTGPGLAYRTSQNISDRAGRKDILRWGQAIEGVDQGNGWVRCEILPVEEDKMLFVPSRSVYTREVTLGHKDEDGYKRDFAYKPDGTPNSQAIVNCSDWEYANVDRQQEIFNQSLFALQKKGYVVLERLLPRDKVQTAHDQFRLQKHALDPGHIFGRMRARRDMTVPPFEGIWLDDALTRHPLIFKILAHYIRNSMDSVIDEDRAQDRILKWITAGSPIEPFLEGGEHAKGRPWLDLMVVVDTPAGAPPQHRHRDVIKPGPCASIGVHIPLTPLTTDPVNGAIGFTPGAHQLAEAQGPEFKKDVVGAVPQGSVILYDSFTEHHGLENNSTEPRCALFAWYRCPAVYSGHADENFGPAGVEEISKWRRHIEDRLRPVVMEARGFPPKGTVHQKGFPLDGEIVDWGEERICFSCDRTGGMGKMGDGFWYCDDCWRRTSAPDGPTPKPANVAPSPPRKGEVTEEMMLTLEGQGMNLRPSRGRHKLGLLRERGYFLPTDPTSDWLDTLPTEPQPEMWKYSIKEALGEEQKIGFDEYR